MDDEGNQIELLDIDEHYIEHSQSFVPSIQKVIANALKDESIFLDKEASISKFFEKLAGYAVFKRKWGNNDA